MRSLLQLSSLDPRLASIKPRLLSHPCLLSEIPQVRPALSVCFRSTALLFHGLSWSGLGCCKDMQQPLVSPNFNVHLEFWCKIQLLKKEADIPVF